jgi:hypothetical protein
MKRLALLVLLFPEFQAVDSLDGEFQIDALAAKQKTLIDLMWIPYLLLTAHRVEIQAEDQVDRPLRANVNVGLWPPPPATVPIRVITL